MQYAVVFLKGSCDSLNKIFDNRISAFKYYRAMCESRAHLIKYMRIWKGVHGFGRYDEDITPKGGI